MSCRFTHRGIDILLQVGPFLKSYDKNEGLSPSDEALLQLYYIQSTGPALPEQPEVIGPMGSHISPLLTFSWSVPRVTYTPETYIIELGTAADNLNQTIGEVLDGSDDLTVLDEEYSIEIQVDDGEFYYRIKATNTHGSTVSEVVMFTVEARELSLKTQFVS